MHHLLRRRQAEPGTIYDGIEYTSSIVLPSDPRVTKGRSLRSGYSRLRKARRTAANVVLALAITLMTTLGVSTPAQAAWYDDLIEGMCPSTVEYAGPERDPFGFLQTQDTSNFNNAPRTAYEKYGTGGLTFSYHYGDKDAEEGSPLAREGDCFQPLKRGQAFIANILFLAPKATVALGNFVYGAAFGIGDTLEEQFLPLVESVTKELRTSFYFPFLNLLLMVAAIYLAYIGIIKRAYTQWFSKFLSIVAVMGMGILLMYQPQHLPNFAMNLVNQTNGAIQNAISQASTNRVPTDSLCYLPPVFNGGVSSGGSGGALGGVATSGSASYGRSERNVRVTQCNMWEVFLYKPWVMGQFGVTPEDSRLATPQNSVTIGNRDVTGDLARRQLDAQTLDNSIGGAKDGAIPAKQRAWKQVQNEVAQTPLVHTWVGDSSAARSGVVFMSMIGSAGGVLLLIVLSISMLVYKFKFFTMLLFMPIYLLIGIHPGYGASIMKKFFATLFSQVLKMIMTSVMIGVVVLIFNAMLLALGNGSGFAITALMMIVVSIGGLAYRKTLLGSLTEVNFNGQAASSGFEAPDGLRKSGSILAGAGAGLLGGLGGAAGAVKAGGGASAALRVMAKSTMDGAQSGAYTASAGRGAVAGVRSGMRTGRAEAERQRGAAAAREREATEAKERAAREADPSTYVQREQETDRLIKEARDREDDATYARIFKEKHGVTPAEFLAQNPKTSTERRDERRREEAREYEQNKHDADYIERLTAKYGGRIPTYLSDERTRRQYYNPAREQGDKTRPQRETPEQKPKPDERESKPSDSKPSGSTQDRSAPADSPRSSGIPKRPAAPRGFPRPQGRG